MSFGVMGTSALAVDAGPTALPAVPEAERESNGSIASASSLVSGQRTRASLSPASDVDYYSFDASAGDLVFATTMTRALGSFNGETQLSLLAADGVTVIETDIENGSFGTSSSSIAGAAIPADGAYFLVVSHPLPDGQVRVYDLYMQLRSGNPTPEVEPNGPSFAVAKPLSGGYVSGLYDLFDSRDIFKMQLNAGDTVFLSLDLDPERDGMSFNSRLGFGPLGDEENAIVVVNDPGEPESPMTIPSEAYEITVLRDGTYHASVTAVTEGGEHATYRLSATVLPAVRPSCRTYATAPSSGSIPDNGTTVFSLPVGDSGPIGRAAVGLDITHTRMPDLDVTLQTPAGRQLPLFTDIGGGLTRMTARFDPFAAVSPQGSAQRPVFVQPELDGLEWLEGQQGEGYWGLIVSDDTPGETGSVADIDLVLCGLSTPAQGEGGAIPRAAPRLSSLRISPQRFHASSAGASISRKSKGFPTGAVISYADSHPALARLSVFKRVSGRKVRGRCVPVGRSNRDDKSCMRHRWRGSFTHRDVAGRNVLRFSGRINGKKFGPGAYKLRITAVSPGGVPSNELTGSFTVIP